MMLITICLVLLLTRQFAIATPSGSHSIFSELREKLHIETFALYGEGNQKSLVDLLPPGILAYPHVTITSRIQWQLKDFFAKRVLNVVRVKAKGNGKLLEILKSSLNRWHLELVVFITSEPLEPLQKWRELFEWCHRNGFFHSLIVDFKYSALLSYDHFKTHRVYSTSVTGFLKYTRHLADFHGFPIRATLGNNPPRALVWNVTDHSVQLSGYYLKALELFASHYNASLNFTILSYRSYYSEFQCLQYISQEKVDICGDAMPMRPEYIISSTEEVTHSFLLVPYDQPLERFYYFVKPYHWQVWLLILASLLYTTFTLSWLHRLQRNSWNIGLNFLNALLSLLDYSFQLNWLLGRQRRLIEVIMMLVGFVVANWYLSILSSLLFTRIYTEFITSLEDLKLHNISIMVSEFEHYILNNSDIYSRISQLLLVADQETLQRHRSNLQSNYAYYSQSDKNQFYLYQQRRMLRPRMKELTNLPLNPVFGGVPMRPYWPLEDKFNRHMSYMAESGLPAVLMQETAEDAIRMGYLQYFPTEYHDVEPLTLEYFEMPATLLMGGYIMGLISFIIEVLIKSWQRK